MKSEVTKNHDLKFKAGFVQCACGWRKELGDGFNGYEIASCPACDHSIATRDQRKVVTGSPRNRGLTASLGRHIYFILSNGLHIQFSKQAYRTETGLTEKQADRL